MVDGRRGQPGLNVIPVARRVAKKEQEPVPIQLPWMVVNLV